MLETLRVLLDALSGGGAALLRPSAKHGLASAAWGLVLRLLEDGWPAAGLSAVRGMPSPGRVPWVCLTTWPNVMRSFCMSTTSSLASDKCCILMRGMPSPG